MTFAKLIAELVTAPRAEHNLLTDGQFTCTYPELPALLEAIDGYFDARGIGPGDDLAFECVNSLPGALILLVLLQKGYRFLLLPPSDDREKAREWKPIARFCRYRVIVGRARAEETNDWMQAPRNFLKVEENLHFDRMPDEGVGEGKLYLRTSGSMGASKIAVHGYRRLLYNALNCAERFRLTGDDRVAIPVPIFHLYGLGAGFLPALAVGACIDLQDHGNILRYLERERCFQPTVAFLTPSFCEMLLRTGWSARPYKRVVTSTQRIREDTFRAFDARFGGLVNLYGSTEMGAIAACEPEQPVDVRATTIGTAMAGVELRIGETRTASDKAPDSAELHCRHPHGFAGYIDETGQWLRRMAPGEWYSTGDLAKADRSGQLVIIGRVDNSVNRDGHLVSFTDIEQALERLDPIEQAVVVAIQAEEKRGQRLAVFCALKSPAALSSAQIRAACFEFLPRYAVPDQVIVVQALPTLASGKVDRQALAAMTG
ncbi:MAG: class I adenylate-forming enzyme family protein [Methylococcales bacterium]